MNEYENPELPRPRRIQAVGYDYAARPKTMLDRCNLCSSTEHTVIAHADRYGFDAQTTMCARCGLTVLNPRMSSADYGAFYEGVYRPLVSAYHGRRIDAKTVQEEQWGYARAVERVLAPFADSFRGRSMLDVGGSTGVVSAHLSRAFGVKAMVLDPAPAEVAEARELGVEAVTGTAEEWDARGRTFELVGMFQTVDHLLDASLTLEKIRSVLAPDGIFFVDIVDFRAVYLQKWSVLEAIKIDHPFSWIEATIEAMLARRGFRWLRKSYSVDRQHVGYVCRPSAPSLEAMPSREAVERYAWELRYVQNAPAPGGR